MQRDREMLQHQLQALEQEMNSIEQQRISLEHENAVLQRQMQALREREEMLQRDRQGKDSEMKNYEMVLEEEARKTSAAEHKCRDLENDVDELKQLLEEEQARVAQVCVCVRACMYM